MAENPIVKFLQQTIRDISKFPTKGIAVVVTSETGDAYTNYHNISMSDKLVISGLIQQDATLDMLAANGFIEYEDDENEDDENEDDENEDYNGNEEEE